MTDIFISYKREEQHVAKRLANALEREGWSVWWDPKLRAGERFDDVIEQAMKASRCVIVLWSKHSVQSHYVKDEAGYALERNKLVPVKIEAVDLPFRFEELHTPELYDGNASEYVAAYQELLNAVSAIIGTPSPSLGVSAGVGESVTAAGQSQTVKWIAVTIVFVFVVSLLLVLQRYLSVVEPVTVTEPVSVEPSSVTSLTPITLDKSVFRDTLRDGSKSPEMVRIPADTFMMGSPGKENGRDPDEGPQHRVTFTRPFAIGRYEVTFEEYDRFATATGRALPADSGWGRGRRPVIDVTWDDAVAYAEWLKQQTGKRYRLPSEAEWESAARAGTTGRYWWCDEAEPNCEVKPGVANCDNCKSEWEGKAGGKKTAPVGSFEKNKFELYDTAGNVWEWVQDCMHDNYEGAPDDGSAWLEDGGGYCGRRVVRGGSWFHTAVSLRSAARGRFYPDVRDNSVGFRLARDIEE